MHHHFPTGRSDLKGAQPEKKGDRAKTGFAELLTPWYAAKRSSWRRRKEALKEKNLKASPEEETHRGRPRVTDAHRDSKPGKSPKRLTSSGERKVSFTTSRAHLS